MSVPSKDLYSDIVNTPRVEQHVLSHCTIAPAVVDGVRAACRRASDEGFKVVCKAAKTKSSAFLDPA